MKTVLRSVFLAILFANCLLPTANCQSIAPTFIGTIGNSGTVTPTMHISYSVGEAVISTFSIGAGAGVRALTQGFQQPEGSCPAVASLSVAPSATVCPGTSVSISPNITGANGNEIYVWSSGQSTSAITVAPTITTVYTFSIQGCSPTIKTQTITVSPTPTVNIAGGNTTLCSGNSATLTASGGTSYSWSTGSSATTVIVSPTIQTIYTVTATNVQGCTAAQTTTVDVNSPATVPIATATPNPVCAGQTISLSASPTGTSYSWSGPNGFTSGLQNPALINAQPSSSGTYSVTATVNGCPGAPGTVSVTIHPLPAVGITAPSTICSGAGTTLTATGGTSYSWNPGGTTNPLVVNPTAPTGYTVTATDNNGCSDTASTFVSIAPAPTASISIGPGTTVCSGTTLTLNASGGNTYVWLNNSQTTASITDAPAGNITYTLVAFNGSCSDTATVAVTISSLTVTASGTNAVCVGQTATIAATTNGGIAPLTYAWSTTPPQATPSIIETYTAAGTYNYSVTITDAAGCSGMATHSVVASPAPVPTITASDTTVCLLANVTLTATGGGTYLWNPGGQTAAVITVNPASVGSNTYSVTVSNGSCSSGTSMNVIASALPSVSASANPGSICLGDTSILSASGAATYTWVTTPPAFTSSVAVSPNTNTTYTVFGTDATTGCSSVATANVTLNSITVDAGPDMTICPGFTAALNAVVTGTANSYAWTPAQFLNDPAVQNPSASPTDSITVFHVTVTSGSCVANDSMTVYAIRTPDCIIKIYNGVTPNGDNDNDVWFIDGIQAFPENRIIIFNRWGTNVWNASGYNNKDVVWKGTDQHGNDLPDGTYYFTVELYDGQGGTLFSETGWVEVTH